MDKEFKKDSLIVLSVILFISLLVLFLSFADVITGMGGRGRRYFEDAASFDNPFTGRAVAEQEMIRSYGYVEAPKFGSQAGQVSTDSYENSARGEVKQVYTSLPVIKPTEPTRQIYEVRSGQARMVNRPVIRDLEDLRVLVCPGYGQKPAVDTTPSKETVEPVKTQITVDYNYDKQGRLTSGNIESMGVRGRRFVEDAG